MLFSDASGMSLHHVRRTLLQTHTDQPGDTRMLQHLADPTQHLSLQHGNNNIDDDSNCIIIQFTTVMLLGAFCFSSIGWLTQSAL